MSNNVCASCGGAGLEKEGTTLLICPSCGGTMVYDGNRNLKEIHVSGFSHEEVSKVMRDISSEQNAHPFLILLTHWSFWFGTILAILGVILVAIGSSGDTEFEFFGQSLKSQNVGIASFFLGAVLVILNVRRILKSFDKNKV